MGSIDLSSVRSCWGNSNFDYVHSDSVGNSGGILCIWDPNSFRRSSFTRSDYFVIVRGVWLKSGIDLMIVVVYAPQEAKEKRMLWDYLAHVSNQWVGKLVMMGDFNEVRYKSDRYGSNFNAHDAEIFNSFIYNAGLDEVPLGGSAYTWCLKSASKMSKLDRFFVSENLLSMCPNITAITLERFISDHRPILLREVRYDYGPIPFRFYRYWLEVDGFDKLVRDSWNVAPVNKKNAIRNFMGKLKFLKDRIRSWLSIHRSNSRGEIYFLKEELRSCDEVIDKGDCSNEVVHKRTEILNKIHQVNNIQASEIAQKAKIKWAIEGDENVKFFHGMLNKKRNQSNIRGIMVNGTWVDDPVQLWEGDGKFEQGVSGESNLLDIDSSSTNLEQSAFISGHQILVGPLILSEIIDWYKKRKKKLVLFKVDFEKAFDFGLHMSLNDGIATNLFHGLKIGSPNIHLSHLFYADDKYDRFDVLRDIDLIFNPILRRCFPKLKETNAFIRPLEGDARKTYGDYVCFNVLEGCQELRKKNPNLFDQRNPKHLQRVIISELEIVKTDMISKRSLQLHDVGVITFKLNGSWIAQRVEKMLFNGIDTWAPVIYERRARAVFLSRTNTPYMNDDMLRADCIKQALVRMFLYSGIDVFDADSDCGFCDPSYEPRAPSNHVYAELETIKYGVCMDKADVMVYVTPHLKRDYIQECFIVRNFYTAA
ncbi:RNA-directed DNA polymerase, eukaryota [Tanacetum coccineum]